MGVSSGYEKLKFLYTAHSINLLRTMVTSLFGARNPHVLACTLRFLRSARLVLKVLTAINRGALHLKNFDYKKYNEEMRNKKGEYPPLCRAVFRMDLTYKLFQLFRIVPDNGFFIGNNSPDVLIGGHIKCVIKDWCGRSGNLVSENGSKLVCTAFLDRNL